MADFIEDHLTITVGLVLGVVCAVLGALIVWIARVDAAEKADFMAECLKDRKSYECVAMWRAGDTKVVPMPIVIPH